MRRTWCILAIVGTCMAGCSSDPTTGYSTKSVFPEDYKTIAVPIIENTSYSRELGFMLTQALITEIEARTPYKVTSETAADSLLTGRITNVELTSLSQNESTGLDEEVVVGVTVDFEWMDLETDRTIVHRSNFEGAGLFVPTPPSGEVIQIGQIAVVQQLASDMVDEMQTVW